MSFSPFSSVGQAAMRPPMDFLIVVDTLKLLRQQKAQENINRLSEAKRTKKLKGGQIQVLPIQPGPLEHAFRRNVASYLGAMFKAAFEAKRVVGTATTVIIPNLIKYPEPAEHHAGHHEHPHQ